MRSKALIALLAFTAFFGCELADSPSWRLINAVTKMEAPNMGITGSYMSVPVTVRGQYEAAVER